LDEDLEFDASGDETAALQKLDNYICELKELQIRDGLHIFGEAPPDESEADLLIALTRVPRGAGESGEASLLRALAIDAGFEGFDPLDCVFGDPWTGGKPTVLNTLDEAWRTNGDTVERLEDFAQSTLMGKAEPPSDWSRTRAVLEHINLNLRPMLRGVGAAETNGLLTGLDGRFVPPGPSGAPSRGRLDVLPTGRNFYSVDTRAVPTPAAWTLGWKSASLLLDRHFQEEGEFPRQIAMSAWGTANMRTGGDDIAQALALLGARPQWDDMTGRVTGFEILPLSVLGRPRVDILFRVSGFFRDAFPFQLDMLDSAIRAVAAQDEPDSENPLAANVREEQARLIKSGVSEDEAKATAAQRVFGSKPGAYGAGLQALIDEGIWSDTSDLAEAYLTWGGYAYGGGQDGATAHDQFRAQLGRVDTILHNQDNREHDLLDSDDYYQFEGGLAAAVRTLSGSQPRIYHNDHSRPESPKIQSLRDEINRIVRARAANPKWIKGVMRHGYKGAFEMAATVDYLFAFAATSGVVSDHHFDQLYDAYLADDDVCSFIEANNPDALREMAARFAEAVRRELWHPRSNSAARHLETLMKEEAHVSENG
jgi:cobaltochelatase CobN